MYIFIFLVIVTLLLYFFGKNLQSRYFAWFIDRFTKNKDAKYEALKMELFKSLHSHVSHLDELKKTNGLKILEVGVGSGSNFIYYPDNTRLIVVDPNPYFKKYFDENRSKFPNIHSEDIINSTGEDMDFIESNSVDVVVMTLVLCSVQDASRVLQQVYRVLAPGGKLYFFEHVLEWDGKKHPFRLALHKFLTLSRIWPLLFDGCCLNRNPSAKIKDAGFSFIEQNHVYAPINNFVLSLISPHFIGYAKK